MKKVFLNSLKIASCAALVWSNHSFAIHPVYEVQGTREGLPFYAPKIGTKTWTKWTVDAPSLLSAMSKGNGCQAKLIRSMLKFQNIPEKSIKVTIVATYTFEASALTAKPYCIEKRGQADTGPLHGYGVGFECTATFKNADALKEIIKSINLRVNDNTLNVLNTLTQGYKLVRSEYYDLSGQKPTRAPTYMFYVNDLKSMVINSTTCQFSDEDLLDLIKRSRASAQETEDQISVSLPTENSDTHS